MRVAKDTAVTFHYTLKDQSGEVIDTSRGKEPLTYLHGHNQIIPGLERQLEGLAPGDQAVLEVPAGEGYGERRRDLTFEVKREQFPPEADLTVGEQVMSSGAKEPRVFTIAEVSESTVVLDANHPLAGKNLHFDVEVVGVRDASAEEIAHGHTHDGTHRH